MYAKSGRISTARRVFDAMNDRDEGPAALGLFDEMVERNIRPDHVSMVAVLSACSHSGLVSDGEKLFRRMVEEYKIRPRMEHYSCMVDLFARAGLLKKAEAMLEQAPLLPTAAMWAALVAASQVYGDAEIGGDRSNPLAPEIYEVLDELSEQMRDVGRDGDDFLGFFDEF
uniref:Pentatricopeptide repeat-containing protein n=1 Tax=Ananas comosus var. bracteatus TaxID=296719 RepID=A0A6V7Q723_ANACO|nr:unnamed protein product [Ananas comosus var. bracteatus]